MSSKSNERVLIGAETYIAGPYHFVKNIPMLVRDTHVAYIDSLKTADGEPLFSDGVELGFIDGEELAEVGLDELEPEAEPEPQEEEELDPEALAAAELMKAGTAPDADESETSDQPVDEQADEQAEEAAAGRKVVIGKKGGQKKADDQIVIV